MRQQGERSRHEDAWWRELYDEDTPDTGPAPVADSLDDRFDSAARAVGSSPEGPRGEGPATVPRSAADSASAGSPSGGPRPVGSSSAGSAPDASQRAAEEGEWWQSAPPGFPPEQPDPAAEEWPEPTWPPHGRDSRPPEGRVEAPPGRSAARPYEADPPAPRTAASSGGGDADGGDSERPSAPRPPSPRAPGDPPVPAPPPSTEHAPGNRPAAIRDADSGGHEGSRPDAESAPPLRSGGTGRGVAVPRPPDRAEPGEAGPARPGPADAGRLPERDPEPDAAPRAGTTSAPRPSAQAEYVGERPPTYEGEPTALPPADPEDLAGHVPDTVLDGARHGPVVLRAASLRGDSARYRGEPRRDALLIARFGTGAEALLLVAVAGGVRAAEAGNRPAADICRWAGAAVGRGHGRLTEDIRTGSYGALKSGLQRLTDRGYRRLRTRAGQLGLTPGAYTATLRCLLVPADPDCRTRVFFGAGDGGLLRLRDGSWEDIEPAEPLRPPEPADPTREPPDAAEPVAGAEPFRFRACDARPGDTLLLCSSGLAEPLRGEPELAALLAARWAGAPPPGLAAFLADVQVRAKGYADDRTAAAVWEAKTPA